MMTAEEFRRIALGHDGVVEASHMGHPDFRVHGRIFASLQSDTRAMVKLTPEEQANVIREDPAVFEPEAGAWGRQGCTRVHLPQASTEVVGHAMTLAWRHTATARARTRGKRR